MSAQALPRRELIIEEDASRRHLESRSSACSLALKKPNDTTAPEADMSTKRPEPHDGHSSNDKPDDASEEPAADI
ncbi:hypothetical protein ColTof4_14349 [Colletotrichum tofieldiae]|nr:hypothetical protein ColTof3_14760 [Colletotrichum tofieldiae]GKT81926.1 hypothetical protein ColTof4_14349 [Colletotrichum tofieldiae]